MLELVADGFTRPIQVVQPPGDEQRLFVVDQAGKIWIVRDGQTLAGPFLDIEAQVGSRGNEQGLLSLVFHPEYQENGLFFIDYTDTNGDTVVARYQVAPDDPNQADPASAETVLTVEQPASNHNGGLLLFGPDGYLYIGLGDGGGGGAPNAQQPDLLLGKLLRIDVNQPDAEHPYSIPEDNPFVGDQAFRPEIWAFGLRNPWRFSFDRETGDLYIADVGSSDREEINVQPADSSGGENYGWPVMEGLSCRSGSDLCNSGELTLPVMDYERAGGNCAVTGGYVYRGEAIPALQGAYLFADYCGGQVWTLDKDQDDAWQMADLIDTEYRISSFGVDNSGELYVVDLQGAIYRLVPGS